MNQMSLPEKAERLRKAFKVLHDDAISNVSAEEAKPIMAALSIAEITALNVLMIADGIEKLLGERE